MARRIRPTAFQGIYEEYDDEEQGLPPVPRANTAEEIAATTGPGLIRPVAQAQTGRMGGGGRAATDPRLGYAELAQRDAEARMRYDIQAQQLALEAQQQNQRGYMDMIREGSRIWEADADRAQQREQFERTGEEGAYRFDVGREDENRRFGEEQARRRFEFDATREDEREQAINAANQRLYEFDQQRMPSQRDIFQYQAERQMAAERMEMESFYRAKDYGVRQQQDQALIDKKLMDLKNDDTLADWEKVRVYKQLRYQYDELEAQKQQTQLRGMQQQQQMVEQQWKQQQKIENMTGAERAAWLKNRIVKDEFGRELGYVDSKGDLAELPQNRAEEMRMKMEEREQARRDNVMKTRLSAWESKQKTIMTARTSKADQWDKLDQSNRDRLENMIKNEQSKPVPDEGRISELVQKFEEHHEKDMRRHFTIRTGMAPVEGIPVGQQYQAWLDQMYPIPEPPSFDDLQTIEPPRAGQQQQSPPDEWGQFRQGQGYSIPPGTGGQPTTPRPEYDPLVNRQPYVPPAAAQRPQAPPAAPAPTTNRDAQDLQALVAKSADPKAKEYGEAAMMMLQEHGDIDRMPPGVQAVYIDLLRAIRGKRDVPPRAHEGRVSGTYGRSAGGGLPVGVAPFGR